MRPSSLLRQVATGASAQRKLPLPQIFSPGAVPRLKPSQADFLPSLINAPTTLPPVFITPKEADTKKGNAIAKQLYYTAKSYLTFYKTGIKQFNTNRKIRKFLKRELSKSFANIKVPGSATIDMTRSEFQLCIRTKRDWRKMPRTFFQFLFLAIGLMGIVFGIVALIFGEFTPLVVWIFGTSFLPGTCLTSNQLDKRRRKRMDDLDRKNLPVIPRVTPTLEQVNQLPRRTIIHECRYRLLFCF
jgi:hypothetical protein